MSESVPRPIKRSPSFDWPVPAPVPLERSPADIGSDFQTLSMKVEPRLGHTLMEPSNITPGWRYLMDSEPHKPARIGTYAQPIDAGGLPMLPCTEVPGS
ncbi:hypothetical protein PUNSTDRAFT_118733 [Punctularia strigosozonata HHB-11173 SS5]|uniref:uncharacterized protein n=1 Tax=Punctularia strigosozonata (strain HHB-11173) TaxID=741275 RepID=UPI00044169D3|nr:uncharacterized protein PUNSTDRAFT_118733 [Punctularia strigosozonata HHB-11173 SS5]EIN11234.1 hypothetical protein PUNSTDRAFT_118733 [Punctularia strigosozonata HHB-11173 SS5]